MDCNVLHYVCSGNWFAFIVIGLRLYLWDVTSAKSVMSRAWKIYRQISSFKASQKLQDPKHERLIYEWVLQQQTSQQIMPNWFRSLIRLATANMQVTLTLISLHPMQNKIPNGWDLVEYQVCVMCAFAMETILFHYRESENIEKSNKNVETNPNPTSSSMKLIRFQGKCASKH